jgi:hypothetical protein
LWACSLLDRSPAPCSFAGRYVSSGGSMWSWHFALEVQPPGNTFTRDQQVFEKRGDATLGLGPGISAAA